MAIVVENLQLGGTGRTVMVKDTIDIAGYPTRASSRALDDVAPASHHADVVQALQDGGCRITGKTGLHELAFGTTGINAWTGTADNPLYPGRIPGGFFSGLAAAVAAGLVDFSLGTDTGGSRLTSGESISTTPRARTVRSQLRFRVLSDEDGIITVRCARNLREL